MQQVSIPRAVLIAIAAVGMLATFLPWIHAPLMGAMPGSRGDGWISFIMFAAVLILAVVPRPTLALQRWCRIVVVVLGGAALALGVWKMVDLSALRSEGAAEGGFAASFSKATSAGIGIYLVIGCGIAAAAVALVVRDRRA